MKISIPELRTLYGNAITARTPSRIKVSAIFASHAPEAFADWGAFRITNLTPYVDRSADTLVAGHHDRFLEEWSETNASDTRSCLPTLSCITFP